MSGDWFETLNKSEAPGPNEGPRYADADIRAASTVVIDLLQIEDYKNPPAILAVSALDGHSVDFACFVFEQSNLDGCRHTWWGEDGYVYYPNAKIISAALEALGRWFDMT